MKLRHAILPLALALSLPLYATAGASRMTLAGNTGQPAPKRRLRVSMRETRPAG